MERVCLTRFRLTIGLSFVSLVFPEVFPLLHRNQEKPGKKFSVLPGADLPQRII